MKKKWLTVLLTTLLFVTACNNTEVTKQNQKEPDIVIEDDTDKHEVDFAYHYPLSGVSHEGEVVGRAIAVMVNNHPIARPQSGLHKADLVYEVLAEGDVTRFLAIFQSEYPEIVGPVRSARDYYIELAKGYNSLYIAHGNSPDAQELLENGYVDSLNGLRYDGTLFERVSFRKAPHNSYIQYKNILKGAEENHYDMNLTPKSLTFLSEDELGTQPGEEAVNVSISYLDAPFSSSFKYDSSLQKYIRYSNGEQTVDYDSKQPVLVDNIFIVETEHTIIDDVGRREIDLTSGGRAYLLQKGKWTEVEWMNDEGRILPYKNGVPVGFVPGKTWINIIPTTPGLEESVSFQ
jgi:hypothetical protein